MGEVLITDLASGSVALTDVWMNMPSGADTAQQGTASQYSSLFQSTASQIQSATTANLLFGAGSALTTGATTRHIMIPSCAGTPTGIPTSAGAGAIPIIFDTTNLRLYAYTTSGVWLKAQFS